MNAMPAAAALKAAGIEADRGLEVAGDFTEESGYEAAKQLLGRGPKPSAVFASNDSMALGALSAFRELGLRVPEDIGLAGFDDIPIARFLAPPLTTVKVPIAELGRRGFAMLVSGETETPHAAKLDTQLVVRRSCGAHLKKS